MEEGLAIATCTLSDEEITLYAKQSVLDGIDHIEISLPVSNITNDRTLAMPITLPQGVTQASLSSVQRIRDGRRADEHDLQRCGGAADQSG